ncbi:MAG: single-stranded DNA-binding protein [Frankiales bacterium]|nr:single-stranded DNA-binding protein [Frankiales bacterium]
MPQSTMTLYGNVVRDVTVRETAGGVLARFRLACNDGYRDRRTGLWVERTTYVTVCAWRRLGENVAASVRGGQPVVVVGRPRQHEWEREGQRHSEIELDADVVGHDLGAGTASFVRRARGPQTSEVATVLERDGDRAGRSPSSPGAAGPHQTDGAGPGATPWRGPGPGVPQDSAALDGAVEAEREPVG